MAQKVFITGGTGFLGSYIIRLLLNKGYEIIALRRSTSRMILLQDIQSKVKFVEGSLSDILFLDEIVSKVDFVIHCAAVVSFEPKDKDLMQEVNIKGTTNIVNACLKQNIQKLIHISSIASIGRGKDGDHISEKSKWEESKLNTQYSITKYESELEVWRGVAEGLDALIFNPSVILGMGIPGEGTMPFFDKASTGFPFYSTGLTGFVDVRDVATLAVKGLTSPLSNERFIVNGDNVKYRFIFDTAADAFQAKKPTIKVTKFLEFISWRLAKVISFFTRKRPFITKETASHSSNTYYYSNKKSIESFDFKYRSLKDTIEDTAKMHKQYKDTKVWKALTF